MLELKQGKNMQNNLALKDYQFGSDKKPFCHPPRIVWRKVKKIREKITTCMRLETFSLGMAHPLPKLYKTLFWSYKLP